MSTPIKVSRRHRQKRRHRQLSFAKLQDMQGSTRHKKSCMPQNNKSSQWGAPAPSVGTVLAGELGLVPSQMSKRKLDKLATALSIPGRSKMNKEELAEACEKMLDAQ